LQHFFIIRILFLERRKAKCVTNSGNDELCFKRHIQDVFYAQIKIKIFLFFI